MNDHDDQDDEDDHEDTINEWWLAKLSIGPRFFLRMCVCIFVCLFVCWVICFQSQKNPTVF